MVDGDVEGQIDVLHSVRFVCVRFSKGIESMWVLRGLLVRIRVLDISTG